MTVRVAFYSYFKEITGCALTHETVPPGTTLDLLFQNLAVRFPKLAPMKRSALFAVGLDYQKSDYVLTDGDEVSLFPPVQGG